MFSHVDSPSNRFLRGVATEPDGSTHLVVPPAELTDEVKHTMVAPTQNNLRALRSAWIELVPDLDLGRIEVLRTVYDGDGPTVHMEVVASNEPPGDDGR
jgi:hypothetical protein